MIAFGALVAVLAAHATPIPGGQFDLTCSGIAEAQLYDPVHYQKKPRMDPWNATFRVDLANSLWCEGKCTEVYSPAIARPDVMVMVESDRLGVRRRTAFEAPDGTFLMLQGGGTSVQPIRARCARGPFTPIPAHAIRVGGTLDMKADPYPPPPRR